MAKRAREQAVKEKRERKHERKAAAAAARLAGDVAPADDVDGEPGLDDDRRGPLKLRRQTPPPAAE